MKESAAFPAGTKQGVWVANAQILAPECPTVFQGKVFKDRIGKRIVLCKIRKSTFFFLVVGEIWDSTSSVFLSSWSGVSLLVVSTRLTSICVGFIICKSFWRIWLRRDLSSGRNMFGVLASIFFSFLKNRQSFLWGSDELSRGLEDLCAFVSFLLYVLFSLLL